MTLKRKAVVVGASLALAIPAAAHSVLSLGPRTLQTLVTEQLFNQADHWYLIDDGGVCFTYLESPRTHLESDRLVLRARLTSRLGQRVGNTCIGADFASNVTLSGRLRGAGHELILEDIRLDRVEDESTRNALNLALELDPQILPKAASVDVLEYVRKQVIAGGASGVRLEQFRMLNVTTRAGGIVVQFELTLSAP